MYFMSAAVILLVSFALIVQVSLPYNNTGRVSVLYNFIPRKDCLTLKMESLKHWELLAKQRSVTSQNTWIFSSLSLWAANTMFCHSGIGNRGNENYCGKQRHISHIMFLWVQHAWIFVRKSDKLISSIMWHLSHTLKVIALTEKFGYATAVLSPHMANFHSLLLFCIVMHQHRPWTTSPLKSYSTKLFFTGGQGIHTLSSNLADIQEISKDQYFGGLQEHIFFLYAWRLS